MSDAGWTIPGVEPTKRGKVRDLYDLGEHLLLVASDRVSAFDVVLPEAIPDKGAILTCITKFWLDQLGGDISNHCVSTRVEDLPEPFRQHAEGWGPRFMLVEKLKMLPIECVVRGYLAGSGWKEYQEQGTLCGIGLPTGLKESCELEHPIFTPATKAESGHDENISFEQAAALVGTEVCQEAERLSLAIYERGRTYARERGIILADTKFEFGQRSNGDVALVLADEVLTPDSSRYWPAEEYRPGMSPPSYDKQYVRNHLLETDWDQRPPAPALPPEVVAGTRARYVELYERLIGSAWPH